MTALDPRIRIRAPLRCDGIGRLDCAEDTESGGRLAVRWLPVDANGNAAAQACAQLPEHPTLPKIRQTGAVGDKAFVAMDFPDGQLLSAFAGDVLPSGQLISICAQIADALACMHAQDTVHGEMSAESVLLVKPELTEKAYLWDMPLVIANRLTDRRGEERLMHQLVKTAAYLSPERARGGKPSAAGDVYALGAIVCIAGGCELPKADTTLGLVHAVAQGTWLPRVPKAIPEPLRSMVDRMVSRNPAERPTAREVADLFMPPVAATPTLREMVAVQLPPELLAKAEALAKGSKDTLGRAAADDVVTGPETPAAAPSQVLIPMPARHTQKLGAGYEDAWGAPSLEVNPHAAPVDLSMVAPMPRVEAPAVETVSAPAVEARATMKFAPVGDAVVPHEARATLKFDQATTVELSNAPVSMFESAVPARQVVMPGDAPAAAAVVSPAVAAQVQLTDNIAVSSELAAAGATALTAEEAAALGLPVRNRLPLVLGAVMGALALVLVGVIVWLANRPVEVVVPVSKVAPMVRPAPQVEKKVEAAVAPVKSEDAELLAPLEAKKAAPARRASSRSVSATWVQEPVAEQTEPNREPVQDAPKAKDFEFLEDGQDLKRPSF